jgi:hypothetical protein
MEGRGEDPGDGESVIVGNSSTASLLSSLSCWFCFFLFSLVVDLLLWVLVSLALTPHEHRVQQRPMLRQLMLR